MLGPHLDTSAIRQSVNPLVYFSFQMREIDRAILVFEHALKLAFYVIAAKWVWHRVKKNLYSTFIQVIVCWAVGTRSGQWVLWSTSKNGLIVPYFRVTTPAHQDFSVNEECFNKPVLSGTWPENVSCCFWFGGFHWFWVYFYEFYSRNRFNLGVFEPETSNPNYAYAVQPFDTQAAEEIIRGLHQ